MFTLLFAILMIWIFGKMIMLAMKATWGITKILFNLVFLPVVLIGLVIGGLLSVAFPILILVGLISLVKSAV